MAHTTAEPAADLLLSPSARTFGKPPKYSGPNHARAVAVHPLHQLAFAGSLGAPGIDSPLFVPFLSVRAPRPKLVGELGGVQNRHRGRLDRCAHPLRFLDIGYLAGATALPAAAP
jgi:hypothetical protein